MNDYSILEQTAGKYGAVVLKNEPMKNHTSFRIGGPCDVMIKINCEALLCELIKQCRENDIKYYVVGRGSNILVCDEGLQGVVLLIGSDFGSVRVDGEYIECNAGASLAAVCAVALENELTGLEFAYGIPGSVGDIKEIPLEKMELSYRHSFFSERNLCITSVKMKLAKGEREKIKDRMDTLMERRKDKQPLEYPSAGSTFKRPEGDFAARLIEVCGLKGTACGGAEVSTKHSGFIINKDNATFNDVMGVVEIVKQRVKEQTGVTLECEVLIMK